MDPYNSADALGAPGAAAPMLQAAAQPANPYAAPRAEVHDVRDQGDIVLASRLARLGASLLDSVIIVVPLMAIAIPAYSDFVARSQGRPAASGEPSDVLMGILGLAFIAFAIVQLVLLYRNGQTVGKKLVGIKIVRSDGSRASFPRLLGLRYFVPSLIGAIPLLGPFFSLANVLFIFGEERRCLHDRIADTIVVNT